MSLLSKIRSYWVKYNPFDIDDYFMSIDSKLSMLITQQEYVEVKLEEEIKRLAEELNLFKILLDTVGDTIPDMLWLKNTKGRYIYANTAIRQNLLFSNYPIGRTDAELSEAAKMRFGEENHTFGDQCVDSDAIVAQTLAPQRFLESGKIRGKMMYLEVFKAPLYINGELFGICGAGRDLTEYVEAYRSNNCNEKCDDMADIFAKYEFS